MVVARATGARPARADRDLPDRASLVRRLDHPRGLRRPGIFPIWTVLLALALAVGLLLKPFVRQRPFVLTVTIIAALSCLYIAGEEMSWGQHFFHWNTPEYWAAVNRQEETNLHNTYAVFDKWPRAILELGVLIGGILIPVAAAFVPRIRANRLSLFLLAAALIPTSIIAMGIKVADLMSQKGYAGEFMQRPSEPIETYLYFFILAYLIIFARRIREIEAAEHAVPK